MKRLMDTIDHALLAIAAAPGPVPKTVSTAHLEVLLQRGHVEAWWTGVQVCVRPSAEGGKELEELLTPGMPPDARVVHGGPGP